MSQALRSDVGIADRAGTVGIADRAGPADRGGAKSDDAPTVDAAAVRSARAAMPPSADVLDAADNFALLGDPGRLRLMLALLAGGELCVRDLAAVAEQSESSVSHALRLLRAHRIVAVSRRGRMAYYRIDDAHVRMLLDLGLTHTQHTDADHPERRPGATR